MAFIYSTGLISVTTRIVSSSEQYKNCVIRRQELNSSFLETDFNDQKVETIIDCVYYGIWYVGKILGRDEEQVKVNVHFFKPPREELTIRGFKLSHKYEIALVPLSHVPKVVSSFKKTSRRSTNFIVDQEELQVIESKFLSIMQHGDE